MIGRLLRPRVVGRKGDRHLGWCGVVILASERHDEDYN